jgi:hypothetical protein
MNHSSVGLLQLGFPEFPIRIRDVDSRMSGRFTVLYIASNSGLANDNSELSHKHEWQGNYTQSG